MGAAPRFKPLQQSDFLSLEHSSSLKGFLKVIEHEQDLEHLRCICEGVRDQLIGISRFQILNQLKTYPFSLLSVQLAQQTTGSGTAFLRWRKVDRSAMGVYIWEELLLSSATPSHLIDDLYAIEQQRIILNMQISLLHSIAKQANECAEKMAHAKAVLQKRLASEKST